MLATRIGESGDLLGRINLGTNEEIVLGNQQRILCVSTAPGELKKEFGSRLTFWRGGVDIQRTQPFGSSDEVRAEVHERMRNLGARSGYVFNTTHNVQARVPVENVLAMYEAARKFGRYRSEASAE